MIRVRFPNLCRCCAALLVFHAAPASVRAAEPTTAHAAPVEQSAEPGAVATEAEASPDTVGRSFLSLAKKMMERKDRESAELAYTELLNSGASVELKQEGLLEYAAFLKQTGREVRAAATYEKFLDEYPDSPRAPSVMIAIGRTLRDMGAFDQALARFYAVLNTTLATSGTHAAEYRDSAQLAKFEIAETFYQRGDYTNAGKYFGRIRLLELPPEERARATFREAYAFYLSNQLEQAVPAFRSYIERFPADGSRQEAHYLLCLTLRKLNRLPEALEETITLLRVARSSTAADQERWAYWQRKTGNQLANDFFDQGDFSSALTIYQTLAQLRNEISWRWPAVYQIGLCYERLHQSDRAAAAYKSIIDDALALQKAGKPLAASDTEIRQMADWRLGQIDWAYGVDRSVRSYTLPGAARKPSETQDLVVHP